VAKAAPGDRDVSRSPGAFRATLKPSRSWRTRPAKDQTSRTGRTEFRGGLNWRAIGTKVDEVEMLRRSGVQSSATHRGSVALALVGSILAVGLPAAAVAPVSATQAAVHNCSGAGISNKPAHDISVRNMSCRAAVRAINRGRYTQRGFATRGYRCYQSGSGFEFTQFRCVRGSAAFRFNSGG
jgi:hypothetical protein